MKKFFKWILIVVIVLVVVAFFIDEKDGGGSSSKSSAHYTKLTPYQQAIMESLLWNEGRLAAAGRNIPLLEKTVKNGPIVSVTASQIDAAFSKNEVKAESLYKGKPLLVSGTIKSIDTSGGAPVLQLSTSNIIDSASARLAKNERTLSAAANMEKGQKILLFCQDGASNPFGLFLNKCELMDEAANRGVDALRKEWSADMADSGSAIAQKIASIQQQLGPNNEATCEKGPSECYKLIAPLLNGGQAKP